MEKKNDQTQLVLITISGQDRPGITSSLMKIIVQANVRIADMGQAVTHGFLSLSILLDLKSEDGINSPVIKDLLFESKRMGIQLDFHIVDNSLAYPESVGEKFILNCVSTTDITAKFISDVSDTLATKSINILRIDTVSPDRFHSVEITTSVPPGLDWTAVKEQLMKLSNVHQVDVAFLKDNVFRRNKRLIVFDMDSTLIQTEVIDELAIEAGVGKDVASITERAMNGEIDFNESLLERVSKLKGLPSDKMQEVLDRLLLTDGAEDFIKTVKSLGYKVAVISGGFSFFAEALKEKLGLDFAFANELEIANGTLTGNIKGTIVNAEQKATILKLLAQQMEINLEQVVAIGDGANDLPMLSTAGLGIAFHAKDIVRKKAGQHMSHGPMTSILYFLGIPGTGAT